MDLNFSLFIPCLRSSPELTLWINHLRESGYELGLNLGLLLGALIGMSVGAPLGASLVSLSSNCYVYWVNNWKLLCHTGRICGRSFT